MSPLKMRIFVIAVDILMAERRWMCGLEIERSCFIVNQKLVMHSVLTHILKLCEAIALIGFGKSRKERIVLGAESG